jgi:hypothetical protein
MLNEFKNTGRGRSSVKPLCQPPGVIARKDIVQAKATQRFQAQLEPQGTRRRERVSALMSEMDAGRKFSRADFERTDRELSAAGL